MASSTAGLPEMTVAIERIRISALSLLACAGVAGESVAHPLDDLLPGHWYEVQDSRLDAHFPAVRAQGYTGPVSVMDAWSGAAYDTKRDQLLVWGGGHMDYAGNEVYAFDVASLTWRRLDEPSRETPQNVPYYPDGRPTARHTYNNLQYVEQVDRLFSIGVSSGWGDKSYAGREVDAFDPAARTWSRRTSMPTGAGYDSITALDAVSGMIFRHPGARGPLQTYDAVNDRWIAPSSTSVGFELIGGAGAVDESRGLAVFLGKPDGVISWSTKDPDVGARRMAVAGTPLESANNPGFVFDRVGGTFVMWNGGPEVYLLDPADWSWRRVDVAAGNSVVPTPPNKTGTYGRFQYVPRYDAFMLVNRTGDNVYFYKLARTSLPSTPGTSNPTVILTTDNTVVESGQSVTLAWEAAGAERCEASGDWAGAKPVKGSEAIASVASTATFGLSCFSAAGGEGVASVAVTVQSAESRLEVSAASSTIGHDGYTSINWISSGLAGCVASGGWAGPKPEQGGELVGPLSRTTQFVLTCQSAQGAVARSVTIDIEKGPKVRLRSRTGTISAGDSAQLTWNAENASYCYAAGDWYGPRPSRGSEMSRPLQAAARFELICEGDGGSATQSLDVRVVERAKVSGEHPADSGLFGAGSYDASIAGLLLLAALRAACRSTAVA